MYDFDKEINRKHTNSIKYDFYEQYHKDKNLIPMWVADMDFETAPYVKEQLSEAVAHGVFGYSDTTREYFDVLRNWFKNTYEWDIHEKWLVKTPGICFALNNAVRAFTKQGDSVMIQEPVYYPFRGVIEDNKRRCINSQLVLNGDQYEIDFNDFEDKIIKNDVKLFFLCNPHNPVGRVWTEKELKQIGEICVSHGVLIISDECHGDFTYGEHRYITFAKLKDRFLDSCIICTSPSKSFNLAGLQVSNIFIPNRDLRKRYVKEMYLSGVREVNQLGIVAAQAAYEGGATWLYEVREYIKENVAYVKNFLQQELPNIHLIEPEGTYLLWMDFKNTGYSGEVLVKKIENDAKLWLENGLEFSSKCGTFERMNIACPRSTVMWAMQGLKNTFS